MIGSIILLVKIISKPPIQAEIPSSRTIGISISMITPKPSALVTSASAPGMKILQQATLAASLGSRPLNSSCFQALLICTACDTPIEKIRNGTRIDIGSIPIPISGRIPSNQTTGTSATSNATTVCTSERE